jgi:hypothetical protein
MPLLQNKLGKVKGIRRHLSFIVLVITSDYEKHFNEERYCGFKETGTHA